MPCKPKFLCIWATVNGLLDLASFSSSLIRPGVARYLALCNMSFGLNSVSMNELYYKRKSLAIVKVLDINLTNCTLSLQRVDLKLY